MKPKFYLEDYPRDGELYVMHCNDKTKALKFFEYLDSQGRMWNNGERYTEDVSFDWHSYGEDTCYNFNEGMQGNVSFYIEILDAIILEFDDFDWDNEEKDTEDIIDQSQEDEAFNNFLSAFAGGTI